MKLTRTERLVIRDQIMRDTVWCWKCGVAGKPVRAVVRYATKTAGDMPACAGCFKAAMAEELVTASQPVVQPAYIAVLGRLMPELVMPPSGWATPGSPRSRPPSA